MSNQFEHHLENSWKSAIKLTTPIFMGYLAAGIAYGVLATNAGLPAWFTIVMCITVFSGTAQYAAIPFFVSGAGLVSIFLSTLLMSLRFIFYTLNMREFLPQEKPQRTLSIGYMTDENFALLSTLPPNCSSINDVQSNNVRRRLLDIRNHCWHCARRLHFSLYSQSRFCTAMFICHFSV